MIKTRLTLAACLLGATLVASPRLPAGQGTEAVADLSWLAGHWRGEGFGGQCEEVWSLPMAGTMVGTFRLIRDDAVVFYEILLLTRENDGIVMKVKHFTPDFVSWEEKEDAVVFELERSGENFARFKGLSLEREGDRLNISIRMRGDDGTVREEPIRLQRFDASSAPP